MLKVVISLAALGVFWLVCKGVAVRLMLPIARNQIERYTGCDVEIESIDIRFNGLAKLKGVVVSSCLDATGDTPLLTSKTILAEFPISSILMLRPRLRSLTVEDFVLDFRYDQDLSSWNLILAGGDGKKKKKKKTLPALVLKRGTIQFSRISGGVAEKIISVDVTKGTVADVGKKNGLGFKFDINPSSTGFSGVIGGKLESGKNGNGMNLVITSENFSTGTAPIYGNVWNVRKLRLDLDCNKEEITVNTFKWEMGDDCKFSLSGTVADYLEQGTYNGEFEVENMRVSDKSIENTLVYNEGVSENVGKGLRKFLGLYEPKGICNFKFKAAGKLGDWKKSEWSGTATCKDISVRHAKFRYLLEHVTGDIILSNKGSEFSNLKCKHDDVDFEILGGTKLVDGLKVTDITISSGNMLLGNDVYRALNKKQQSIWYTFTPRGRAKIEYKFHRRHDQIKGRGELEIDMLGGEADYLHFPYHLENITGLVRITPEEVEIIDLASRSEDSSITLNGKVTDIRSTKPSYNILINAKNIPLDSRLKAALPHSQRSFFDSFKMTARTDAEIEVFPNHVGKRPVEYIARVSIKDATLMYENFPLPLTNVNVEAVLTPLDTNITNMTGRNGDGTIKISGKVWPSNETYPEAGYCLKLDAKNIQIDDRWLKTLPADSYKVLSKLRPKGEINVAANLNFDSRTECPDFKIVVESLGGSVNYTKFPYPIENIFGKVIIEKDMVTLENLRSISPSFDTGGEGQAESIRVDGTILTENHKVKDYKFSVDAKNIDFDKKLIEAFGGYSGDLDNSSEPSGKFDLAIKDITYKNDANEPGVVNFASVVTLKGITLNDKGALDGISGNLKSTGTYQAGKGLIAGDGQYIASNIEIKGKSIKNIRGRVIYDPNSDSFLSREYTANCYGGKILGSFSLINKKDKKMDYSMQTVFSEVDLHDLVVSEKKAANNNDYTKGKVSGYFGAAGTLGDDKSRIGRLNMRISGMEFAKRTLLGKIITASQLEDPTNYIFSNIGVESYLQGNTLFMDKVLISGKSMQMKGTGKINMTDGKIGMEFNASGKPSGSDPSFWDIMMESFGPAVVQVKVDGTLKKPEIKTTVLQVITKPFEILGTKEKRKE